VAPAKPRTYSDAVQSWERWYDGIHKRDDVALGALDRLLASMAVYREVEEPSARECEVIQQLAYGRRNAEIAAELGISRETVKSHLKNVTAKLRANNGTHLVALAWRRCLID
jgi:DNA-binding CsgD family transcriptional regulator